MIFPVFGRPVVAAVAVIGLGTNLGAPVKASGHTVPGVSARGLSDARPRDGVSLGIASGYFSEELRQAQRDGRLPGPAGGVQDYETVVELTYRFDFRESSFFIQPDFQYIIQPGGTAHLKNAPVLGLQLGINF